MIFSALMLPAGLSESSPLHEWEEQAERDEVASIILGAVRRQVRRFVDGTGGRLGPDEWSRASAIEQDLIIEARAQAEDVRRGRLSVTLAVVAGELALMLGADAERVSAYLAQVGAPEFREVLDDRSAEVVANMPGVG